MAADYQVLVTPEARRQLEPLTAEQQDALLDWVEHDVRPRMPAEEPLDVDGRTYRVIRAPFDATVVLREMTEAEVAERVDQRKVSASPLPVLLVVDVEAPTEPARA